VCDLIDRKVFVDGSPGCSSHERALGRIELDQQGSVTKGGTVGRMIGHQLVQPGRCRIDFRRGAGHRKGRHALSMFYQKGKGW